MSPTPAVGIVVVAMNDEPFIAATLESMLGQTYPNIRIHVQHGAAGTDRTLDVVRQYPVSWASEPDTGYPDAANRGFSRLEAEFLMFQAGDDPLMPDCIKTLADALSRVPEAGFAYGDIDYIDATGRRFHRVRGRPYDLDDLYWYNHVTTQSVLMRRHAFVAAGSFRTGIINADWDLYLRMGARFPAIYIPKVIAQYRVHDRSHSLTHLDRMILSNEWVTRTTLADPVVRGRLRRGKGRALAGSHITVARLHLLAGSRARSSRALLRAMSSWPPTVLTKRGLVTLIALILGPARYARLRNRGRQAG